MLLKRTFNLQKFETLKVTSGRPICSASMRGKHIVRFLCGCVWGAWGCAGVCGGYDEFVLTEDRGLSVHACAKNKKQPTEDVLGRRTLAHDAIQRIFSYGVRSPSCKEDVIPSPQFRRLIVRTNHVWRVNICGCGSTVASRR